jgi:hypothetical protein
MWLKSKWDKLTHGKLFSVEFLIMSDSWQANVASWDWFVCFF